MIYLTMTLTKSGVKFWHNTLGATASNQYDLARKWPRPFLQDIFDGFKQQLDFITFPAT